MSVVGFPFVMVTTRLLVVFHNGVGIPKDEKKNQSLSNLKKNKSIPPQPKYLTIMHDLNIKFGASYRGIIICNLNRQTNQIGIFFNIAF